MDNNKTAATDNFYKYEVRNAPNGDLCIMLKNFNARIATFSKGTNIDAEAINKLLAGHSLANEQRDSRIKELEEALKSFKWILDEIQKRGYRNDFSKQYQIIEHALFIESKK